jgi:hypothetical protein
VYGLDLIVAGKDLLAVEASVVGALAELELAIVETATVASGRARYDLVADARTLARHGANIEVPSIAIGPLGGNRYTIDVRGPRSPLWQLGLAQRVSQALGGWAVVRVNDRLRDEYGYGVFLCGHPMEGGVRCWDRVIARFGIDPWMTNAAFYASLDEDANNTRFRALLLRLAGDDRTGPPAGQQRVFFLAPAAAAAIDDRAGGAIVSACQDREQEIPDPTALPWLVLRGGRPQLVGTLAGLSEQERARAAHDLRALGARVEPFDADPTYSVLSDGTLDEEPTRVLLVFAEAPLPVALILDAVSDLSCPAAFVELGSECRAWSRAAGARFVRVGDRGMGVGALSHAFAHVTTRAGLLPMNWMFRSALSGAPPFR